ncbi:MAG: hypothetical protein WEA84_14400 [Rhodovibrionaceae bacterium]
MPRLWGAPPSEKGWEWFESPAVPAAADDLAETALAFARCFAGRQGDLALSHLRRLTQQRHLGPEASDTALRHLEGQRQLVAYIASLVERGRDGG